MTASTRRAALGAILAAPLVSGSVAAFAVSPEERTLLALGPQLVKLLDEYDELWSRCKAPYAAWETAREHLTTLARWEEHEELPEWAAYMEARRPADELEPLIVRLYEPFMDMPLTTLPAIMLRHRYGMTFDQCRDDAQDDIDRLWREGTLCA